jgi:hypothetical protein
MSDRFRTRTILSQPEVEALATLRDSIVEWATEDADRYERISLLKASRRTREQTQAGEQKNAPAVSIITVVLAVPRPETERVTKVLRAAPNVKPEASYLMLASQGADPASKMLDDALRLEARVEVLERLCLNAAARIDDMTMDARLSDSSEGSAVKAMEKAMREAPKANYEYVKGRMTSMREAIAEKKVNVAAQLLAEQPDDEL